MDNRIKTPYECFWMKFTDYYKYCDNIGWYGATYGFVFAPNKPQKYEYPCEHEGCVYIGKSSGNYYDKQAGHKGKGRSHVHKRMTHHLKPLMNENVSGDTCHKLITEVYGCGKDVLDGTLTNLPMWLGLILPQPDFPKENKQLMSRWCLLQEQDQLMEYQLKFRKETLANSDANTNKDLTSYSSYMMGILEEQDLSKFMTEST